MFLLNVIYICFNKSIKVLEKDKRGNIYWHVFSAYLAIYLCIFGKINAYKSDPYMKILLNTIKNLPFFSPIIKDSGNCDSSQN